MISKILHRCKKLLDILEARILYFLPKKEHNMDQAKTRYNWFNYHEFYNFISKKKGFYKFVEVGVWKGHSVSYLADKIRKRKGVEIYAVDLFEKVKKYKGTKYEEDAKRMFEIYNANLLDTDTRHLIKDIKTYSHLAAKRFKNGQLDVVFIDADHQYISVIRDIKAWLPKIKPGGIIAGHDYNNPNAGVKEAVLTIFNKESVNTFKGGVWYVYT